MLLWQKSHTLDSLNNRNLFLMVLETKKSKIKMLTDSLPDLQVDTLYVQMVGGAGQEGKEAVTCLF